jgi:hypothetical protein
VFLIHSSFNVTDSVEPSQAKGHKRLALAKNGQETYYMVISFNHAISKSNTEVREGGGGAHQGSREALSPKRRRSLSDGLKSARNFQKISWAVRPCKKKKKNNPNSKKE